ncbi:MAG: DUF6498-containing protein [Gammaproteobacteria bacterium]
MSARQPSSVARLRALPASERPPFRFAVRWPWSGAERWQRVLPLPRSWPAVAFVAVMLAVFCVPLLGVASHLQRPGGDLFDLTTTLFHAFWLLGWSLGVLLLALVLLLFVAATEVVMVDRDTLVLRFEILRLGVQAEFPATRVVDLRVDVGDKERGDEWRGPHLAFDYLGIPMRCGSGLDASAAAALVTAVRERLAPGRLDAADRVLADTALQRAAAEARTPAPTPPAAAAPLTAWSAPSTLALVLANLVPLAGVAALGWRVLDVLLLYWAESVVIGLYNVLRLAVVARWGALVAAPFFVGHYGAFMSVHLLFLFALFGGERSAGIPLAEVATTLGTLWPALLALVVSHGVSFATNFIARGEHTWLTTRDLMQAPYARVAVMQVTIIVGGMLVMAADSPIPALVLLVLLKLAVDLQAHRRQHHAVRG